jgi:hypothetical protein
MKYYEDMHVREKTLVATRFVDSVSYNDIDQLAYGDAFACQQVGGCDPLFSHDLRS